VIVYDPLLSTGQSLSATLGWHDHRTITQGTIDLFASASRNALTYQVVATTVVTDGWPAKVDGFRYTESEYLGVKSAARRKCGIAALM
jgi:hypothetical protein